MNKKIEYYNRVRPIIGNSLAGKRVAVFDPSFSCLIADALARCGVKKQIYFFSKRVFAGDYFCATYGNGHSGLTSGNALKKQIISHNSFEDDWEIGVRKSKRFRPITKFLETQKIDLIIAGGKSEICFLALKVACRLKIPAVVTFLLKNSSVNSAVFASHPALPALPKDFFHQENISATVLTGLRLDWLEALDVGMNLAKTFLLRGTVHQRDDWEELLFEEKRNLILRGQKNWPWWICYTNPELEGGYLKEIFSVSVAGKRLPAVKKPSAERVMVLGCGTGSLLIGELVNYFRHFLIVDCKPFSIHNPVRQLAGTKWIGRGAKPFVLQRILLERNLKPSENGKKWSETVSPFAKTVTDGRLNVSATELCLKESIPDSVKKFEALLDWFKPTLVIVAMGRTHDDNFTACEILHRRGIKHVVPSAFAGATHFKTVVVDEKNTPCYECLQNKLPVDIGPAVSLNDEMRSMLYSDPNENIQPATIIETWPSAHQSLRLCLELAANKKRSAWFSKFLSQGKTCFVGGNASELKKKNYLYGIAYPGQVVAYGQEDLVGSEETSSCPVCGRENKIHYQV